jgi:hypothetical protein
MKKILLFLGALAAYGQQVTLSDTLTNAVGGGSYTGRITVTLAAPGNAQPLYYSTTSLGGWQYVLCVGVTGSDCSATTAAGVVTIPLYANSTITPAGTSYTARYQPAKGAAWSEVWTVEAADTKLYQVRATTVPTPTTTFQPSQIAPGSNGQVLSSVAGVTAWAASVQPVAGTVGALPAAAAGNAGTIAYVIDANATTIGSTVAAGGSNKVLVWSNGTAWKIYAN